MGRALFPTAAMAAGVVALLAACSGAGDGAGGPTGAGGASDADGPLARAFEASAADTGVPRDLLVAIAVVEDGLGVPAERLELHETEVPAAGPLMLRHGKLDTLARGAALTGTTERALREHADLALEAGARVLAELGAGTGARGDDLASWSRAVDAMSGYADDAHRESYVHRVFAALARGGRFEGRDGEIVVLPRHDVPPSLTLDVSEKLRVLSAKAEYPGAEWIPTSCANKCDAGRDGAKVSYVVIHDTEGGWDASVATLQNDPNKSVQYIVGVDGRVAQFVTEETTAWHAGNYYYNQRSVGIEHVGYSTKAYPEAEYAASAKLVDYLATKYGVARDRAHVIGHDQIPNPNEIASSSAPCSKSPSSCEASASYGGASGHDDPGVWEWATYMARIAGEAKCDDVTAIWNCSHDKARAFRCVDGEVEVATCGGGCEVEPNGQDDLCHVAPASTTPPGEVPFPGPDASGAGTPAPPPVGAPPEADEGGCSVAAGAPGASRAGAGGGAPRAFAFGAFATALAFVAATRRRRARAKA